MFTFNRFEELTLIGGEPDAGAPSGARPMPKAHAEVLACKFATGALRKIAGGQTLWSEGDACGYVYLVRSGSLSLSEMLPDGRRVVLGFAFPGDVIGIGSDIHACDAAAIEPTRLDALSNAQYRRAMKNDPVFFEAVRGVIRRSLKSAQEHVVVLSRLSAGERVAHFLVELSEQMRRSGGDQRRIRIAMRRADFADYLGLTVETICRTLTAFKCAGLIAADHRDEVLLLDMKHLTALATGESDPGDPLRRAG